MKSGVFNYYGLRNNDHDIQLSPDHLFGNRDYCCRGSNPIDTKIERRFDAAGDVRSFQKGDKGELGEYKKTSGQGMMGAKMAIMEADALLDSALKSMSMPGMSMADRLRVARYKYPKLNKVWWAHKLRNQLVHESSFQLGSRQAKQALEEYERAFKTMNLL